VVVKGFVDHLFSKLVINKKVSAPEGHNGPFLLSKQGFVTPLWQELKEKYILSVSNLDHK